MGCAPAWPPCTAASIDAGAFVLAWLFMALGSRPSQFASVKVKDVHARTVEAAVDYSIDVPRAKQHSLARSELKNRPPIRQLGEVVMRYAGAVRTSFEDLIPDVGAAPLLPAQLKRKAIPQGLGTPQPLPRWVPRWVDGSQPRRLR